MLRHGDSLQDLFISRAAHGFLGYFWGVSENIADYASLRTENRHLAEEILRLTETITRLEEEAAAAAARDSADYTTAWRGKYEFIPAAPPPGTVFTLGFAPHLSTAAARRPGGSLTLDGWEGRQWFSLPNPRGG